MKRSAAQTGEAVSLQETVRRKVGWRLLPFVFILYIIASLDRANVAYAKLTMTSALGFSEAVFGFGSGIFFVGYLLFEIPGALIVERHSARLWMARVLITWGACAVVTGFIKTAGQFYLARFFLGLAEGGFFPGMIVYLTHWFCARDRARAMAGLILAIPVSFCLGAPLSAFILKIHWAGLAGWRWIFILEGVPAVLLGLATVAYLPNRPRDAAWLKPEERDWLVDQLEAERQARRIKGHISVRQALRQRNVLVLALALFFANVGAYAFIFWLPSTIQKASGRSVSFSASASALPFLVALVFIVLVGRSSDIREERKWHTVIPLALTAVFFALSAFSGRTFLAVMFWLCCSGAGLLAWTPSFWVLPTLTLGESAAAAAFGLINSIGNLGGFAGPTVVGYLLSVHTSPTYAQGILAGGFLLSAVLVSAVRIRATRQRGERTMSIG